MHSKAMGQKDTAAFDISCQLHQTTSVSNIFFFLMFLRTTTPLGQIPSTPFSANTKQALPSCARASSKLVQVVNVQTNVLFHGKVSRVIMFT